MLTNPLDRTAGLRTVDGDLESLVGERIARTVRTVVRAEMFRRRAATLEDIEDVCSDAMVAFLSRLEREDAGELEDLEAYAAGIARRACSAWSRRRYPEFHRLRSRLRYLLRSDRRFALWQDAEGSWIGGQAAWSERRPAASPDAAAFHAIPLTARPAEVVAAVFSLAGQPLYFNDLARVCAQLWEIEDTPETLEAVEHAAPTPEPEADYSARLARLWEEIRQLPQRQCAALLLNLRGADGESAANGLVLSGVTTLRALATLLGYDPLEFAELWTRLPLSDLEIAAHLQITRQQVINLRKCARERLTRRMGDGISEAGR